VESIRTGGCFTGTLNSTFLALIPKTNNLQTFGDYRPILLCNLLYKLILKVLSNRIKPILSRRLSTEHFGFLEGRLIQDAIGTAHECIHSINQKHIKAFILKLDLQKAFYCVNWDFLRLILIQVGFGTQLTRWIMECVSSASLEVLVYGEATNFFKIGRGLRQGCPLSPLLFVLVMESLSLILKSSKSEASLSGIKITRLMKILHLFFVDDVLLMTNATLQEWKEIKCIIQLFCSASGLKVNLDKSTVHFSGLEEADLIPFKQLLPYKFTALDKGFKYLGYFLKAGHQKIEDWKWLITKVEKRISHWSFRWLSLGGRFTLCKAVLESQPMY
jgi:hypothetical protein